MVITGASSGIGLAMAREFIRRGHQVVLVARRAELLATLAADLGPAAHAVPVDLSRRDDRASLLERDRELGLTPDVLVNNAGLATMGPVAKADPVAELNLVEVDVAAVVDLCCRFVLSYTHSLRAELAGTGVSASTLCPGPVKTGFGTAAGFSDADAEAEKMLPKFLWKTADQVALAAVDGLAAQRAVILPGARWG